MLTLLIVTLYLLCGFALGLLGDSWEMKKEVPYGDAPAITTLKNTRIVTLIFITLFGIPLVSVHVVKALKTELPKLIEQIKKTRDRKKKLRRSIKNLDRISKQCPEIKDLWDPIRERVVKNL